MEVLGLGVDLVERLVEAGGYFVLFALLFACGLGLPLPEDIPLIVAGALAAAGKMNLWIACAVCWAGIIGGDIILYRLGRKYGMNVTRLPWVGKHFTEARIKRVEQLFDEYGIGVVAVGRMFAGIRGAMVVTAGTIRFNFWKFVITDSLAAIVSGGFFVAVGHWLGQNLNERTIRQFKHWFIAGGIVVAIGIVVWILWRRRHGEQVVELEAKVVEKVAGAEKKMAAAVGHTAGKVVETVKQAGHREPPAQHRPDH
jgi:membrane protein DedA with SNARE-associated domain